MKPTYEELQAQVENLWYVAKELSGMIGEYRGCQENSLRQAMFDFNERLRPRIRATPAACLAQVKADAGRAGFIACGQWVDGEDDGRHTIAEAADQYAERIRQGVV